MKNVDVYTVAWRLVYWMLKMYTSIGNLYYLTYMYNLIHTVDLTGALVYECTHEEC